MKVDGTVPKRRSGNLEIMRILKYNFRMLMMYLIENRICPPLFMKPVDRRCGAFRTFRG
jgi:hypothetical protein